MLKFSLGVSAMVLAVTAYSAIWLPGANAQQPNVERKVLLSEDLPGLNQSMALVSVTIPVGGREGRHTHSGSLAVYVLEGAVTLDYEGKPTVTYSAGDSFFVEAGKIHEGINNGNVPARAIATFVTEKGKPLTTQVE